MGRERESKEEEGRGGEMDNGRTGRKERGRKKHLSEVERAGREKGLGVGVRLVLYTPDYRRGDFEAGKGVALGRSNRKYVSI